MTRSSSSKKEMLFFLLFFLLLLSRLFLSAFAARKRPEEEIGGCPVDPPLSLPLPSSLTPLILFFHEIVLSSSP